MSRLTSVGAAGVLGFGLAVLGISWFEFRSRRLGSTGEVAEGLGIQVLGRLPKMSAVPGEDAGQPGRSQPLAWFVGRIGR